MLLYCNIERKFERAVECADYLREIAIIENSDYSLVQYLNFTTDIDLEKMGITNHAVRKSLSDNPEKRAFLFMQVGIAYSMYSDLDNECCKLYSKRKLMKKKAC